MMVGDAVDRVRTTAEEQVDYFFMAPTDGTVQGTAATEVHLCVCIYMCVQCVCVYVVVEMSESVGLLILQISS